MPELPEVETTLRGIAPHLRGRRIHELRVRQWQLRWPIPADMPAHLAARQVRDLRRRGKYLLLDFDNGSAILHLGMSGSLRVLPADCPPGRHDHVDFVLEGGGLLRLTDPRRFGALLWTASRGDDHPLLRELGPEPLSPAFDGAYLYNRSRDRRLAIKAFIMDSKVVAGVGNIYANEALFLAGIRPGRAAGRLSRAQCAILAEQIKSVLEKAIAAGGTTLRDFLGSDGKPGYFKQELFVYGRAGETCRRCEGPLKTTRQGQRATVYCPRCQR